MSVKDISNIHLKDRCNLEEGYYIDNWCDNGVYVDCNGETYGLDEDGEIDWDDKCVCLEDWLEPFIGSFNAHYVEEIIQKGLK